MHITYVDKANKCVTLLAKMLLSDMHVNLTYRSPLSYTIYSISMENQELTARKCLVIMVVHTTLSPLPSNHLHVQ